MRLKPDGSLDLDWREQDWPTLTQEEEDGEERIGRKRLRERYTRTQRSAKTWDQLTVEEQRQQLIEYLLRARPTLTHEKATEQIDAFF